MNGRVSVLVLVLACLALGHYWGRRADGPVDAQSERSYLAALTEDLKLRPGQVAEIGLLLSAEDKDIQALIEQNRRQLQGPIAVRLDQTMDAMLVVLDVEQRAMYHEMTGDPTSDG